eukprot:COSAG02_NODE_9942_length_2069_cov_1.879695_4_plen_106_part_01
MSTGGAGARSAAQALIHDPKHAGGSVGVSDNMTQPFCLLARSPLRPVRRINAAYKHPLAQSATFAAAASANVKSVQTPGLQHFLFVLLRRPVKHGPALVICCIHVA